VEREGEQNRFRVVKELGERSRSFAKPNQAASRSPTAGGAAIRLSEDFRACTLDQPSNHRQEFVRLDFRETDQAFSFFLSGRSSPESAATQL
jgi:hypothetical protein